MAAVPHHHGALIRVRGLLIVAIALPVSARGQWPSCVDRVSQSDLTRVPVYLVAEPADTARSTLATADALLRAVADRMRATMGGTLDQLPSGDSVHHWYTESRGMTIAVADDGRFVWGRQRARSEIPSPRSEELLVAALSAARDAGERLPRDSSASTVAVELTLRHPTVRRDGTLEPISVTRAVPVFTTVVPREEPARAIRAPRVNAPRSADLGGAHGVIRMRFVVDTAGRIDMNTVQVEWPAHVPYPTGELLSNYRDFVSEVTSALRNARYHAARAGGCKVRAEIIQPFEFQPR
jgi:hypothetical protein